MLILFDYFFYRSYTYPKDKVMRFFRSVALAWAVCFWATAIPFSAILTLFFKYVDQRVVGIIMFLFFYHRYKKKHKVVVAKFQHNKVDKYLPLWIMSIFVPVLATPCICFGLKIIALEREYHVDGIITEWLLNLFS